MYAFYNYLIGDLGFALFSFCCAVAIFSAAYVPSKAIAVNLICATLASASLYYISSAQNYVTGHKSYFTLLPILASLLLHNVRYTTVWLLVSCACTVYSHLLFEDDRPVIFELRMNICWDMVFSFLYYGLTYLYERERLLAESNRSKFVASVSHELRTPLNDIVCAAELLLDREEMGEEDLQDVGTIFGCGQLMSSLINNVLDAEMFHTKKRYNGVADTAFQADEV